MKITFNMIGGSFQHAFSSCGWERPKYVEWNKTDHSGNISVHIDGEIFTVPVNKSKINIAWFCESPYFTRKYAYNFNIPHVKEKILNDFKWVFSSDLDIISKHPEIKYVIPHAFTWIEDRKIFPKNKWVSIIASGKNEAPGHKLRHIIVDSYKDVLEVFGGGYKKIKSKNEGLNDFMYSFAIENIKAEGYFTEKVVDCFATGTIPIYWGSDNIKEYFLEEGIIKLSDGFDLAEYKEEFYFSKKEVIKENFNRSLNLPLPEDYIYLNYLC